MEHIDSNLQNKYLQEIQKANTSLTWLDNEYSQKRKKIKAQIAKLIEEARFESDLTVAEVAKHLGKSRQAVNSLLIDVYGIRHVDKQRAARLGHIK